MRGEAGEEGREGALRSVLACKRSPARWLWCTSPPLPASNEKHSSVGHMRMLRKRRRSVGSWGRQTCIVVCRAESGVSFRLELLNGIEGLHCLEARRLREMPTLRDVSSARGDTS